MSSYRNQAKSDLDREDLDLKDDIPLIKARHEKFFLRTLAVLPQVSYQACRFALFPASQGIYFSEKLSLLRFLEF